MQKLFGRQRVVSDEGLERRGCSRQQLVINPLSQGRMFWDVLLSVVILYSAVEIPFSTAFLWEPPVGMVVIDWLIDLLLWTDVVVCLFTGYVRARALGRSHWPARTPARPRTATPSPKDGTHSPPPRIARRRRGASRWLAAPSGEGARARSCGCGSRSTRTTLWSWSTTGW